MKIKKGKLNYDQSGRAYPPNPRVKENWDCIWEYEGKYYKLVGDNEHKEWDEVNIYNQIIDEVYENYEGKRQKWEIGRVGEIPKLSKEEFINKCKTDTEFSEMWGLKIEERKLSLEDRIQFYYKRDCGNGKFMPDKILKEELKSERTVKMLDKQNIPTKLITLTYKNETIESYE